jgi:hypothetical protein
VVDVQPLIRSCNGSPRMRREDENPQGP